MVLYFKRFNLRRPYYLNTPYLFTSLSAELSVLLQLQLHPKHPEVLNRRENLKKCRRRYPWRHPSRCPYWPKQHLLLLFSFVGQLSMQLCDVCGILRTRLCRLVSIRFVRAPDATLDCSGRGHRKERRSGGVRGDNLMNCDFGLEGECQFEAKFLIVLDWLFGFP